VTMSASAPRELYFSFFMFTADLRPNDPEYRRQIIHHAKELVGLGYAGFDVPVAPPGNGDYGGELAGYVELRHALDAAGLEDVPFSTNVGATRTFDPTSAYAEQRQAALSYLKSRVDITAALRGRIMAGPIIFPYAVFPVMDSGEPLWSDALREWASARYGFAQPILNELGEYAQEKNISLAIEPVDHWETPAPNLVREVMDFLQDVPSPQLGVCIDSAHVMLGGDGPRAFAEQVQRAGTAGRIHSVHISPPDRGSFEDSWIPWQQFLEPVLAHYDGPLLVETFNAVAPFITFLRLGRKKFWIPGEDPPDESVPDAYTVAARALDKVRSELSAHAHA
jgi:D-psicose/D-tagatose/L-ribulose 3-epimerase